MKILKIFGLVVGVHAAAFLAVFAVPGCRSTRRHSPPPPASVQAGNLPPAPAMGGAETPVSAAPAPSGQRFDAALNPGATAPAAPYSPPSQLGVAPTVRFNPTRPGARTATSAPTTPTAAPTAPTADPSQGTAYTVGSGDTLWKIAKVNNLSVKELAAANSLRADAPLRPGQKLVIPAKATPMSTPTTADTAPTPADTLVYTVRAGDTLAVIARRAGTTVAALRTLNALKNDTVRVGQNLRVPAGAGTAATLAAAPDVTPSTTASRASGGARHLVKPGENLGMIARRYGVSRRDLAVANNIVNPQNLRAGQELVIPGVSSSAATAEPAAVAAPQPAPASEVSPIEASPVAPASDNPIFPTTEASPIAPAAEPPVIQVEESNPIAAPRG